MTSWLAEHCPRLALARDEYVAERAAEQRRAMHLIRRRLHLEWLVAHRELQLVRAQATGRGRYIAIRQRKLDRARSDLAAL